MKVNAVLDPTTGLEDAVSLLRFCLDHDYRLRIIEQMPLDAGHEWSRGTTLGADDILAALQRHFTLTPDPAPRGSAPAQLWLVDGGPATVGIIASVSHAFCSACDRTRLTADGQVRSCLFSREETDLRGADARRVPTMTRVEAAWRAAMWAKPAGHGINDPGLRAAGPPDERDRRVSARGDARRRRRCDADRPLLRRRPRRRRAQRPKPWTSQPGTTVAALVDTLAARGPELARVLRRCSFLCDGIAVRDEAARADKRPDNRCAPTLCGRVIVIYVT